MPAILEPGRAGPAARRRRLPVACRPPSPWPGRRRWPPPTATGVAGRFHHDALLGRGPPGLADLAGYAVAWTVMVTAMMLPSAVPLLRLFAETSADQGRRGWLAARPWLVGAAGLAGWRPWPG